MVRKAIDLFCGAGGMSLGFADKRFGGGFSTVLAIDNDEAAIATHKSNFSGRAVCDDINAWLASGAQIPKADIVIGGPPCQGFSLLNKKRGGDARRALWEPFLDVVVRSHAPLFIMENVPGLRGSEEFNEIVRRAEAIGFGIKAEVLNTANYGVPQTRKRTIIAGWKKRKINSPEFPPRQTHAERSLLLDLNPWVTVRDAISDLPVPKRLEISGKPPLDLHIRRFPTPKSLARYMAVPAGGNRFDLQKYAPHITPDCWIRKRSGGTDLFGRLWWDRPSVTIRTEFYKPEKGRYLHPDQHRPITHREAARLMGFPDDFVFCGSKVEIARQIGNAVPPPFAGALAKWALDVLAGNAKQKHARREIEVLPEAA